MPAQSQEPSTGGASFSSVDNMRTTADNNQAPGMSHTTSILLEHSI